MTAAKELGLARIAQIGVSVRDVPGVTSFYRDKLGLKLLFEAGGMAFFDCAGIRLMLSPPSKPEFDHPSSILYFQVDDIRAAHAALAARGVAFEEGPHVVARLPGKDVWMAFFRDCERNLHAITSEVASS